MNILSILIVATGTVPYFLLVRGILTEKDTQNFASWFLWLCLDGVVLKSLYDQHGSILLFSVYASGTLAVVISLLYKRAFSSWGDKETLTAFGVFICIVIYYTSGPYWATITTVVALNIAGIPQVKDSYRYPEKSPALPYILLATSALLAVINAPAWTVQDRLPQMSSFLFCSLVALLSLRKKKPAFY